MLCWRERDTLKIRQSLKDAKKTKINKEYLGGFIFNQNKIFLIFKLRKFYANKKFSQIKNDQVKSNFRFFISTFMK